MPTGSTSRARRLRSNRGQLTQRRRRLAVFPFPPYGGGGGGTGNARRLVLGNVGERCLCCVGNGAERLVGE
jgi:hypothetical protein